MNSKLQDDSQVSVVMSVHNGHVGLAETLESILNQDDVRFEFIIVNDGSTDETSTVLRDYARRDGRLRVIDQEHLGLTRSLIHGCSNARGKLVARQDAGDISLPGRLKKQVAKFIADPTLALVSCGTRFFGPCGELLYEVQEGSKEADNALRSPNLATLHGPSHHGCTMFSRERYVCAGGYRSQFEVAQDLDLWTRLVELGRHEVVQEVLYEAVLTPGAISGDKRVQQETMTKVISECMRSRRATGADEKLLDQAVRLNGNKVAFNRRKVDANFYYFLASCLRRKDPRRSKQYLMAALKNNPLHFRALVRVIQAQIGTY